MMAFHGDAKVKTDLLKRIAGVVPLPRMTPTADRSLIAMAADLELPAAVVLLAAHLAKEEGEVPSAAFASEVVSAIHPGADLRPIGHLWTAWVWEGADESLHAMVDPPPLRQVCAAVIDMHRREAGGQAIGRGEWRAARATLGSAAEGNDVASAAAAAIGAAAWDYHATPGAVIDVLNGWRKAWAERVRSIMGWRKEDSLRLQGLILEQQQAAEARIEADPMGETAGADGYRRRRAEEILSLVREVDESLVRRNAEVHARISECFSGLRRQGRRELLALLGRTAAHPAGSAG